MNKTVMQLKFWGVKGSHVTPGKNYVKYGGNTPCVEILRKPTEEKIIFDAGSGLGFLGTSLAGEKNVRANIFLSHIHPDHRESLPHFFPLYHKDNEVKVFVSAEYAKKFMNARKCKIDLNLIMGYPLYPIDPATFPTVPVLNFIVEPAIQIDDYKIEKLEVDHYEGATIYKVTRGNKQFVYAPDVADFYTQSEEAKNFCQDVNTIIWDSVYKESEVTDLNRHKHTAVETVIKLAQKANVQNVVNFHHSPLRKDKELTQMEKEAKKLGKGIHVVFARDQMIINI
jgi:ribonuclease Z